ncbi:hypothetical protein [Komarekiella delphini-convector]|nr:hypothetical protein [Komarekiella delphini-convector]
MNVWQANANALENFQTYRLLNTALGRLAKRAIDQEKLRFRLRLASGI